MNSKESKIRDKMMSYMPTCEEVTRLKSDSMDSGLTLREKFAVKFHLMFCQWCRKYGKQIDMIRQAIHKLKTTSDDPEYEPNIALNSESKDRLKRLLNN